MLPVTRPGPTPEPEVCAIHVQAALSATAPPDTVIALHGEHIRVAPAAALPPGAVVLATRVDLTRLLEETTTGNEAAAAREIAATVTGWAAIHHTAA